MQPVCDGGGSEHALIRMIRQLVADGWECHVAVPAQARLAREYAAAGAQLHVIAMQRLTTSGRAWRWVFYAAGWPVSVVRLWLLARRLGVSVVHSNSLHCWYGWAAARLARRPHVWHAREMVFQSALALRVERVLARRFAAAVIAVSSAVADQLDPANVVVVYDGADRSEFRPDRAGAFRQSAGLPDDAPIVGSVARVDTWKGFGVLLEAFPAVRGAVPDAQLVVAGGAVAGKEEYFEELAGRAATMDGVRWIGPRSDVADLMADLDVFVQVSTEPEPFGLVLVEALASGVPVVAGEAGGPLDIVTSAEWGRLVPPGDCSALAAAVTELLPPTSSTSARRSRAALGPVPEFRFSEVIDLALSGKTVSGTRRPVPRP